MIKKVYIDSSVFLAFLKEEQETSEVASQLFDDAAAGELEIWTSTFTLSEVLFLDKEKPNSLIDQEQIRNFFDHSWINLIDLSRAAARKTQDVFWGIKSIKPADSIHVACAISYGIKTLYCFDKDLCKLDTETKNKYGLSIEIPTKTKLL